MNWQLSWRFPTNYENSKANSRYQIARYEIALGKDSESGELTIVNETLWLCPEPLSRTTPQNSLFPNEPVPPASVLAKRARKGWYKVISKAESGYHHSFNSETGVWSGSGTLRINPRRPALANLLQGEKHFPIALWVQNLLMEGIHVLALNSAAMRRPSSPSVPRAFRTDGSNLPLVVRDLRNHHEEDFKDWLEHLRTVLPDLKMINVIERPEDRHLYLTVHYSNVRTACPFMVIV